MSLSELPYFPLTWFTHLTTIKISRVARWIAQFPLATIQRMVHLCFPESQAWGFARGPTDVDADVFNCFEWRNLGSQSSGTDMVIAVQPPWVLSPQDLKSFTEIVSVSEISPSVCITS